MSTFISTVNMTILGCFVQHELTLRRELDWQAIWLIVNRLLSLWDELHKSNILIHIRFSPKCQCLFNRLCLREYSIQWAFLYNCVHFLQFKHNKPGRDLFSPPHAVWERGFQCTRFGCVSAWAGDWVLFHFLLRSITWCLLNIMFFHNLLENTLGPIWTFSLRGVLTFVTAV